MCGIAGFFTEKDLFEPDEIKQMTYSIAHRGRNSESYFTEKGVALGHRRLSILDLSDNSNQPFFNENKNLVLVFNGEIYNFRDIAKELNTDAKSDTQILLKAFENWGVEFVNKLNGMFAIAIYDRKKQNFYLFRDRIGIKPLFYYFKDKQFAFASEIKALLQLDYIQKRKSIDYSVIPDFLQLGYIPEPKTIYNDIYKFPKGCYAIFENRELQIKPYWKINDKINTEIVSDEEEAKLRLKTLLESSVKKRLISDVPYGAFLSGGVDSSLISAIAQKVSNTQLKTFSIGFAESKYDETTYADQVSQHIQSEHFKHILTYNEAIKLLPDLFKYYDEPFADTSAIPTMMVAQMAKQNVSMTLSGDGGDELFHGYGAYNWANRLDNKLLRFNNKIIYFLLKQGNSKFKRVSHLFNFGKNENIQKHIFSQEQYFFSQQELQKLVLPPLFENKELQLKYELLERKLTPEEKQALFDLNYYLPDDLLVKVDRATMRSTLETRVPLLDHNIVEFAINLHPNLKRKGKETKYLLKQVLYDYVPQNLFDRPKWGFSIPLADWLNKELRFLLDDYLSDVVVNQAKFVSYSEVEKLKEQFFKTKRNNYLYNRLWLLACLHKWYIDVFLPR